MPRIRSNYVNTYFCLFRHPAWQDPAAFVGHAWFFGLGTYGADPSRPWFFGLGTYGADPSRPVSRLP